MSSFSMKRCKGCIFWQQYHGEVTNPVMRKMMNLQAPRSRSHACVLRLHDTGKLNPEGEPVLRPSFNPQDPAGPRYGERTSPNDSCSYHFAKNEPYRRPGPIVEDWGTSAVEGISRDLTVKVATPVNGEWATLSVQPMEERGLPDPELV